MEVNDHLESNEKQRFVGEICISQCPHTMWVLYCILHITEMTQLVSASTIFYRLSAPTLYGCIKTETRGWEVSTCNTVLHSKINVACFLQKPHSLRAERDSTWVRGKPKERLIMSTSQEQHYNVNQNRLTELGYCFNLPTHHREKYVKKKPGWREMLKIKPSKSWTFTENITVKLHKHTMCT